MDTTTEEKVFTYKTKSLDELSVCLAMGAELTGRYKEDQDDRFYTFVLKSGFDMEKISLKLASRALKVCVGDDVIDAYDLLEAVRRAKSVVHTR